MISLHIPSHSMASLSAMPKTVLTCERRVSFDEHVRVRAHLHVSGMTQDEVQSTWYHAKELTLTTPSTQQKTTSPTSPLASPSPSPTITSKSWPMLSRRRKPKVDAFPAVMGMEHKNSSTTTTTTTTAGVSSSTSMSTPFSPSSPSQSHSLDEHIRKLSRRLSNKQQKSLTSPRPADMFLESPPLAKRKWLQGGGKGGPQKGMPSLPRMLQDD
jgi:hypothetical protein